ncbi:3-oxoacyl-ACP reductase [Eremococcus coleocola]|uniref:Oxidoreductase, short chain dehydrogenase/reductase family protein n=1 Tax=Eremococcus coleocola ACS-139-V-Col8 TaxID=908337 RepID=E4KQN1_9LACT|nr:oxidoreductase, short chain dehydrogenase/reductase family protein [Eremococcus coleocola ACS-139-V-Col8]
MVPVKNTQRLPETLTVIVTGAASGIGAAQVDTFLKAGHKVFALDRALLSQTLQDQWQAELDKQDLVFCQADLSQAQAVDQALKTFQKHFNQAQVLCNTAGQLDDFKSFEETDLTLFQDILSNNLTSMYLVTQAFLPYLKAQAKAVIINMASIAGLGPGGGGIAYTASKHAIVGFTKQLAYEYAAQGIRINAIAPGSIQTPMTAGDFQGDQAMAQWVAETTPIKRWAQPQEVADLTLFLASNQADYLHGTVIPIDGGWLNR